jgi:hypothetical protein
MKPGGLFSEVIALKRVSITRPPHGNAADVRSKDVRRITLIPAPAPANDTPDRRAVIRALVDDLAALAAELYFSGRLAREESDTVTKAADKKGPDDV